MKFLLIGLFKLYQYTMRPFVGSCCCFYPTCSDYAILAVKKHGALRGSFKTVKRILRCGPYSKGGVDLP